MGEFTPRGGISTRITAAYSRNGNSVGDEELAAVIQAVRERARSRRYPNGSVGVEGVSAPDLMPLAHARDAAEAKVAAIGTVNPRPPGLENSIAQRFKKLIARVLDWHVREQVEFNRAAMACVQASLEAMADLSRGMAALAAHHRQFREETLLREAQLREDFLAPLAVASNKPRSCWISAGIGRSGAPGSRTAATASEIHMLRTISELQGAFQHRVTLMDQSFRESVEAQHAEFKATLGKHLADVQARLWQDLAKMRGEFEALIYTELRVLRQKQARFAANAEPPWSSPPPRQRRSPADRLDALRRRFPRPRRRRSGNGRNVTRAALRALHGKVPRMKSSISAAAGESFWRPRAKPV